MSGDVVDFVPLFILEQLIQVLLPETTKEIFLDLNINLSSSPLELTNGNIPGPYQSIYQVLL